MTPEKAGEIAQTITDRIHFEGRLGAGWESIDENSLRGWASHLLSRIAFAVGTDDIEFVSGYVTDSDERGIVGDIAVFTADRLIRATFEVAPGSGIYQLSAANVRAVARTAISRIDIVEASMLPGDSNSTNWPQKLRVELTIDGDEPLPLPLTRWNTERSEGLSDLLDSLTLD